MTSAVEELEKAADLCRRIRLAADDQDLAANVLSPVAIFLGAETASFRSLCAAGGTIRPHGVVSLGIARSVDDAYLTRYYALDPARRLLHRRLTKPLFADPMRSGEWSEEHASPAQRRQNREEFLRYRKEFLLPNHFYHHVGFCFQDSYGRTLLFDFHRPARAAAFGSLELARAQVVAVYLQAKANQCAQPEPLRRTAAVADQLSVREIEVAQAVAQGLSNKQVALNLGISVRTVENHMRSIFAKLRVSTRTRLAAKLHETPAATSRRLT